MKKLILVLSVCFSITMVSCKETDKKTVTDSETEMSGDHAADKADIAMNAVYQCPMDCEEGKTYEKEGNCPVCKMALKKGEGEHAEGENHDNDESHSEDNDEKEGHEKEGDGDKGHKEGSEGEHN